MNLVNRHPVSLFQSERQEYRLMYAFSFPVFLGVSLLSRLVPARIRPIPFARGSFFAVVSDARAAAHSVLPYAFMR